jgi:hypothetical protein
MNRMEVQFVHPVIEEICRIPHGAAVRPDVIRRWQATLRDEVSPLIANGDALLAENARLRDELAKATKPKAKP